MLPERIMSRGSGWKVAGCAALFILTIPTFSLAQENVYKKALPSTVWIVQPTGGNRIRMGSGSLIDAQKRLVLTNYHVVGELKDVFAFFPIFDSKKNLIPEREKYMDLLKSRAGIVGKVLFAESSKDLAVIQLASVPKGTPALRLAKDSPSPGDRIHSIGSPGISGALFNYTDGSVKSVYEKKFRSGAGANDANSFTIDARIIETSSGTNKGDSGGPLLNDKCELIGVTQGMLVGGDDVRPISFFIDVSEVRNVLKVHHISLNSSATTTVVSDMPPHAAKPEEKTATKPADAPPVDAAAEQRRKEEAAEGQLNGAKLILKTDKKQGKRLLQRIVDDYPNTDSAREAKKLLETIK
jgi:S1-C subfamily serine protease